MPRGFHFISGLPRAGSTLLAALLQQNPAFHAGITSPLGGLYTALLREMSARNEAAVWIEDAHRRALLGGLFRSYYGVGQTGRLVFDTHRLWCSKLAGLATLFPAARVIACVRHVSWIVDSLEQLVQRNAFEPSGIYDYDPAGTVYTRANAVASPGGLVGFAYDALKQAYFGPHADRLILVQYESLTERPIETLQALYRALGEPWFAHDPESVALDASAFDARIGTPGLHAVARRVAAVPRDTILPPDLFRRFEGDAFWRDPSQARAGVTVL